VPQSPAECDLGSASLPIAALYLAGTSSSAASNNFRLTGAATGWRTWALQDTSDTFVGRNTADALANKTIDTSAGNVLRIGGVGLNGVRGNSGSVLMAGTVSGAGAVLCTDSAGNATTSGCSSNGIATNGSNGQALTSNGGGGFGAPVTLSAIATSGSYADLANKPTLSSVPAGAVAAGSTFSIPAWIEYAAAVCQGNLPSIVFSLPVSSAPTPACKTGSNTQFGVAQFTATGQSLQGSFVLPEDWISMLAVDFRFLSESSGSAGNVAWNFSYACVGSAGGSIDPAFSAAQTVSVAAAVNNTTNFGTLSPVISGCSAGQRLFYRLGLDSTTTATGNQDLIGVRFKVKRTVTTL
jgi:hypothetical protein